jgi:hypothetical protein
MRLLFILALALAGCGNTNVGSTCHADDECQPLVCNAPYVGPNGPPAAGTCQHPAGVGGVCHRPVECEDGLTCLIPAGGNTLEGGTCQK